MIIESGEIKGGGFVEVGREVLEVVFGVVAGALGVLEDEAEDFDEGVGA